MPKKVTYENMLKEFMQKDYKPIDNSICGKCSCCGECCSNILPINQEEANIIKNYVIENNIKPQKQMIIMQNRLCCPYYDGKKCLIYEVRPLICKLFYCYKKPSIEEGIEFVKGNYIAIDMWSMADDIEKMRKKIKGEVK